MPQFQWFPGHMAKTLKELDETIALCDLVLEVCDARIVNSSRNPEIDKILGNKKRILILNKKDLADPSCNAAWQEYFKGKNITSMLLDARSPGDAKELARLAQNTTEDIVAKALARGRRNRPIRAFVVGVPNSGKSTLINSLIGKSKAKTANKPGVTRSLQWWKWGDKMQLLDSPGLLWPKFENKEVALALGACASIKDEVMPQEELAGRLLRKLLQLYPEKMLESFKFKDDFLSILAEAAPDEQLSMLLDQVAENFGFLQAEGKLNQRRAANFILKQFRSASLGRLSLESPPQ